MIGGIMIMPITKRNAAGCVVIISIFLYFVFSWAKIYIGARFDICMDFDLIHLDFVLAWSLCSKCEYTYLLASTSSPVS